MVISGRQRQVKLIPVRALGGDDVEWIKVNYFVRCLNYGKFSYLKGLNAIYL